MWLEREVEAFFVRPARPTSVPDRSHPLNGRIRAAHPRCPVSHSLRHRLGMPNKVEFKLGAHLSPARLQHCMSKSQFLTIRTPMLPALRIPSATQHANVRQANSEFPRYALNCVGGNSWMDSTSLAVTCSPARQAASRCCPRQATQKVPSQPMRRAHPRSRRNPPSPTSPSR